jgi:hypothetical protein
MVGIVFAWKHREKEMEVPTKEGRSTHKDSEGTHSVVGCAGVAYAANTHPAHYSASPGGDHPGKDDTLLAEAVDGLLAGWLGDAEDPGEPPD